jgi:hypothetical protein
MMVLAAGAASPVDAKARDAVAGFEQLCAGMFTGAKSDIDPSRFSVTELSPETVREIKPELKSAQVWDVSGKTSDVHMLVHYEPTGMCVFEVADADESAIRSEYVALVGRIGATMKAAPTKQPDRINDVNGKPATTSMWQIKGTSRNLMFAITTYPDPKFMIQHLMTVSYVR